MDYLNYIRIFSESTGCGCTLKHWNQWPMSVGPEKKAEHTTLRHLKRPIPLFYKNPALRERFQFAREFTIHANSGSACNLTHVEHECSDKDEELVFQSFDRHNTYSNLTLYSRKGKVHSAFKEHRTLHCTTRDI